MCVKAPLGTEPHIAPAGSISTLHGSSIASGMWMVNVTVTSIALWGLKGLINNNNLPLPKLSGQLEMEI